MTERDIKLLWGRSGNRCAFALCRIELSQDKKLSTEKYPLGEQAHIVGERESAARGKSNLSDDERDGYSNRLLLCPTHHTQIDRDEHFYSVERLHLIKQQHELWVQERLSERTDGKNQAEELVYSALVDAAVVDCYFSDWNIWVSTAANGAFAQWPKAIINGIAHFHDCVFRAPWSGARPELENALKTLALTLFKAREVFLRHADYENQQEIYVGVAFYSRTWHEEAVYDRLLKEFNRWVAEYTFWLRAATRAANWVADVVRREMNPMFFAQEGRFVYERISDGMTDKIPEFSSTEKRTLPDGLQHLHSRFMKRVKKQEELIWNPRKK